MVAAIAHLLVSVISAILVSAAPLLAGQNITTLTLHEVSEFTPYTYYAGAAYCHPSQIWSWSCRAFQRERVDPSQMQAHTHINTLQPRACIKFPVSSHSPSVGTGLLSNFVSRLLVSCEVLMLKLVQGYVGYNPTLNTVIVAHQGTDCSKMQVNATPTRVLGIVHIFLYRIPAYPSSRMLILSSNN